MTDGDLYERFECVDPPRHRKFYELEVELAFFYPKRLIRRWGKIGTRRPRELRCIYATPDELLGIVEQIRGRRLKHGYQRVSPSIFEQDQDQEALTSSEQPSHSAVLTMISSVA